MGMETLPILTASEREALINAPKIRYLSELRNQAILILALNTGMRISEIVGHEKREGGGLRLDDVDLNSGRIDIRDAKDTRKQRSKKSTVGRTIYASPETLEALRTWIDERSPTNEKGYFFCTSKGTSIEPAYIRRKMREYGKEIGLPPDKRHIHALRHTFASEYLEKNKAQGYVALLTLQQILGHSNLQTTSRYAHLLNQDSIRETMQAISLA